MYYLVSQEFHKDVDTVKAWPIRKTVKHILFLTIQDERMEEKMDSSKMGDLPDLKRGQPSQQAFHFLEKDYTIG